MSPPSTSSGDAGGSAAGDRPLRILVVCTGNICRSPMAEGMIRTNAGGCRPRRHGRLGRDACRDRARRRTSPAGHDGTGDRHRRSPGPPVPIPSTRRRPIWSSRWNGPTWSRSWPRRPMRWGTPSPCRSSSGSGPGSDPSVTRPPRMTGCESVASLRNPAAMLRADPADEVDDPYGRGRRAFNRCADQLDELCAATVELLGTLSPWHRVR